MSRISGFNHGGKSPGMPMEINRFIKDMIVPGKLTVIFSEPSWAPPTDVFETPTHFIIKMEIAGIQPEKLSIVYDNKTVYIKGRRDATQKFGRCVFSQMEINYGNFERTLQIETPIDANGISASYEKGFLEITLPKSHKAKSRKISVEINL